MKFLNRLIFKEEETLSVDDISANPNTLRNIELPNEQIQFKLSGDSKMKSI